MKNMFDDFEVDSAINKSGEQKKSELEIAALKDNTKELQQTNSHLLSVLSNLEKVDSTFGDRVKKMNDACTVKITDKTVKQYEKLNEELINGVSKAIKQEVATVIDKMRNAQHRWMIPDIAVCMMILINVLLMLFTILVLVANYVLHESYIWKIAAVVGSASAATIGIALYVYFHFRDK